MVLLTIFLTTASIQGQQSASEVSQSDDPKPCVVVVGAVRVPGRIEIRRQVRLHEVLAAAGGLTARAGKTIQLVHTGSKCFQSARAPAVDSVSSSESTVLNISDLGRGEEKANPYIVAGDLVIVSVQEPIYVVGNVVSPGGIFPKEPLTLTEAIRRAGGIRLDGKTDTVVIYRQQKDKAAVPVAIDLNEIKRHRTKDPILEPYDIVYVGPGRPGPRLSYPNFDTRPLIPKGYRVIY